MIQSAATHKKVNPPSKKVVKQVYPSPITSVVDEPVDAVDADDNSAPTREELVAKAEELGIEFRKNISETKLLGLIEAELASEAEV
jgi:uncharacterized protein (DUF1697 family)